MPGPTGRNKLSPGSGAGRMPSASGWKRCRQRSARLASRPGRRCGATWRPLRSPVLTPRLMSRRSVGQTTRERRGGPGRGSGRRGGANDGARNVAEEEDATNPQRDGGGSRSAHALFHPLSTAQWTTVDRGRSSPRLAGRLLLGQPHRGALGPGEERQVLQASCGAR